MHNPTYTSSSRLESFCLTESSTVQDFLLLTRRLAHGSCSWPTRWTIDQAVLSRESNVHSFPIARAKLKLFELFECDGIYGIE